MIIFMLTMMNVLVVTNNLISDTASVAKSENESNEINRTIRSLISTQGTSNWGLLDTQTLSTMNWSIGLLADGMAQLDQYKLARLKSENLNEYALTYEEIGSRLPSQGRVYRLEVFSPLNNSLLSITPSGNNLRIIGVVNLNGNPVSGANITLHLVILSSSGSATVQTIVSSTNATGYYDLIGTGVLPANFVGVVSFADYLGTLQDSSFVPYVSGTSSFSKTNSTVLQDDPANPNIASLNVEKEAGNTLSQTWMFYPGGEIGQVNYTELDPSTFNSTPTTYTSVPNISLPSEGSVVLFSLQNSSFTNGFYSIDYLPTYLDNDENGILQPLKDPNAKSSTSTVSVVIRDLVVFIRLTVWEVEL